MPRVDRWDILAVVTAISETKNNEEEVLFSPRQTGEMSWL